MDSQPALARVLLTNPPQGEFDMLVECVALVFKVALGCVCLVVRMRSLGCCRLTNLHQGEEFGDNTRVLLMSEDAMQEVQDAVLPRIRTLLQRVVHGDDKGRSLDLFWRASDVLLADGLLSDTQNRSQQKLKMFRVAEGENLDHLRPQHPDMQPLFPALYSAAPAFLSKIWAAIVGVSGLSRSPPVDMGVLTPLLREALINCCSEGIIEKYAAERRRVWAQQNPGVQLNKWRMEEVWWAAIAVLCSHGAISHGEAFPLTQRGDKAVGWHHKAWACAVEMGLANDTTCPPAALWGKFSVVDTSEWVNPGIGVSIGAMLENPKAILRELAFMGPVKELEKVVDLCCYGPATKKEEQQVIKDLCDGKVLGQFPWVKGPFPQKPTNLWVHPMLLQHIPLNGFKVCSNVNGKHTNGRQ